MNTQYRVSLSFEVEISMNSVSEIWWDMTDTDIRNELASEGNDVKFYIRHRLDPEEILDSGAIQKAMVTHVEVTE